MNWTITWSARARRDLRTLGEGTARRIIRALDRLALEEAGDRKRLRDRYPEEWRLRVGRWRVIYSYDREARVIGVIRVLPRGRAYRR